MYRGTPAQRLVASLLRTFALAVASCVAIIVVSTDVNEPREPFEFVPVTPAQR